MFNAAKLKASELGVANNVIFHGVVDRKKGFSLLNQANIYVQHSVTALSGDQEGFPVSLAEAALHALPIVSTIHSGITENVIDGVTGFTVQEYNYVEMASKISFLLDNASISEEMGQKGRENIINLCQEPNRFFKIKEILVDVAKD